MTSSSSQATGSGGMGGGSSTGAGAGPVTIAQITDPSAPGFVTGVVELHGVVATSTKFLARHSPSACTWGVFLSSPGLTVAAPHTAILAFAKGTPPPTMDGGKGPCPVIQSSQPAGDAFPDDTKPGDVFDIVGFAGSYMPTTCVTSDIPPGSSNVPQYLLRGVISVVRTAMNAKVPAPHVLSDSEAAALAAGTDAAFLGAWGGARVAVEGVTAELQQGSFLDPYGQMLMNDGLRVGDKLYYIAPLAATDACHAPPSFPTQTPTFASIAGFAYLDGCTWGIQPADKCHDLSPPSDDCASMADAGPDAGPAEVCVH
jgi:hypothetical protein